MFEITGKYGTAKVYATTLEDESPMAYKDPEDIISNITDTCNIVKRIFPIYNFKAADSE